MADDESKAAATADTMAVSSITTRSQKRKAAAAADAGGINNTPNNAADDTEKPQNDNHCKKEREPFKGKSEKMAGNVFQLAAEGRKANQYTLTIQALHNLANVEMENAKDLAPFFEDPCRDAKIEEPDDEPPMGKDGKTHVTRDHRMHIQWRDQCEQYNQRKRDLDNNKVKIFTIALQQCSQSVTNKIEATNGYAEANANFDCKWLLTTIKNVCHNFEHTDNRLVALVKAKAEIFQYRQGPNQSTHDYHDTFNEQLAVLESYGGRLHDPIGAAPPKLAAKIAAQKDPKEKDALMRNHYVAVLFLRNANPSRYQPLREELKNDFTKGRNEYPTSVTAAYQMLLSRTKDLAPPKPEAQKPVTTTTMADAMGEGATAVEADVHRMAEAEAKNKDAERKRRPRPSPLARISHKPPTPWCKRRCISPTESPTIMSCSTATHP
jgi:hypothetical protein